MIRITSCLITLALAIASTAVAQKSKLDRPVKKFEASANPKDAKNMPSGKPLPPEDPELAKYYFAEKTLPLPAVTAAIEVPTGSQTSCTCPPIRSLSACGELL